MQAEGGLLSGGICPRGDSVRGAFVRGGASVRGGYVRSPLQAHPLLQLILGKFFQLILLCKQVPAGFGHSYIVPVPKTKDCITKALTCEDFRGMAISSIISKLTVWRRNSPNFSRLLTTNLVSKRIGCNHLYTLSVMSLSVSLRFTQTVIISLGHSQFVCNRLE